MKLGLQENLQPSIHKQEKERLKISGAHIHIKKLEEEHQMNPSKRGKILIIKIRAKINKKQNGKNHQIKKLTT